MIIILCKEGYNQMSKNYEDKAIIAKKEPKKVELEQGKSIYWCACGRSSNQPYCDGSHKSTSITPKKLTAEKDETVYLCQCKQTSNPPFCDGSHKKL